MLRHKQGHASMLSREQFVTMSLKQDLLLFGHLDVVIYNMANPAFDVTKITDNEIAYNFKSSFK